jgi:hypothetical protein
MMNELSKQIDIAKHVIDGSLTIDSIKEFEGILQIFPKDPELHRAFSNMLMRKKRYAKAAEAYHRPGHGVRGNVSKIKRFAGCVCRYSQRSGVIAGIENDR